MFGAIIGASSGAALGALLSAAALLTASPAAEARPAAPKAVSAARPSSTPKATHGHKRHGAAKAAGRAAESAPTYAAREDAMRFAAELAERRGWDRAWVERHIGRAKLVPSVRRLIMPPPTGTAKNWAAYRARFIEPARLQLGLRFWDTHAAALERAEAQTGVPAELIVGIIGVETYYGRIMGDFRVVDALATLAFDFPPGRRDRSEFFRTELEELLAFAQKDGIDPGSLKGSYAGAIGLPQFMPSSLNRNAVDFDGDGHVDLIGNPVDAIGSVANYLLAYGWQRGMPTHHAVEPPTDLQARATLLAPDIVPSFSAAQMQALGAKLDPAGQAHAGPLALVELQNGDAPPSHVAGTANFYVVTRYNWSSYYALAVIELGAEVARLRRAR